MAVIVGVVLMPLPAIVGTYVDDGVYLCTAKSLAEGHGYRHVELPGEPHQTKYPVLYPLVLALVWRLFPQFPQNVHAVQVVNIAFWTLGLWLAYRLMRREWRMPAYLAGPGVILALVNPGAISLLRTAMSEPLYLLLSMAALLWANSDSAAPAVITPGHRSVGRILLAALAAAGAYLTRSIGLAVIMAGVAGALLRRRWMAALGTLGVAALAIGGWQLWCHHAAAENAANPAVAQFRYDLGYAIELPPDLATAAWVAYQNTSDLALALLQVLVDLPEEWITATLRSGFSEALPLYIGIIVAGALLVAGLRAAWDRCHPTVHLYLLVYVATILIWPFSPRRPVIALLPLVATLQLAGLYVCVAFIASLVSRLPGLTPPARAADHTAVTARWPRSKAALGLVAGITALLVLGRLLPLLTPLPQARAAMEGAARQRENLVRMLETHTPPDAVISSPYGGYLHLRTGRKVVPPLPQDDPIPIHYPDDRRFAECGRVNTGGMVDANRAYVERRLAEFWRTTGTGYVVPLDRRDESYWAVFNRLGQHGPTRVTPLDAADPFSLYGVSAR
jgi:hypothetical protein